MQCTITLTIQERCKQRSAEKKDSAKQVEAWKLTHSKNTLKTKKTRRIIEIVGSSIWCCHSGRNSADNRPFKVLQLEIQWYRRSTQLANSVHNYFRKLNYPIFLTSRPPLKQTVLGVFDFAKIVAGGLKN